VPHCFIYVWRHGVQRHGVDGRPGESRFRRGVMARPMHVQERLRGWRHRGHLFEAYPYEDSRVPLAWGRVRQSGRRGGVLSPHASTTSGMVMQWPGWCRDGEDGRTGLMAMEVTLPLA
jgi:hypothetical protein